ncbi:MAG: ABC transporter ATP-binding protein, partial [Clostridia bacterium]|nr:ABC transporter ATP-binding protein [Clostridia bacterium]
MKDIALKIENLSVEYGSNRVLNDICLQVKSGEVLGIIGPNGGGKTTLLKAILGLVPISSGSIEVLETTAKKGAASIGYVPQHAEMDKNFPINVVDTVLTGCVGGGIHPFFRYSKAQKQAAVDALAKVGIADLAEKEISSLSGGQFQRMLIARAIVSAPKILFLDEPTASVDPASREQIYNLLAEL